MRLFTRTTRFSVRRPMSFLLLSATVSLSFFLKDDLPWNLTKNEDGIQIYTRVKEGSNLKEFKGLMTVKAPLRKIESYLDKPEQFADWQEGITTSRVLQKLSDSSSYVKFTSELPWPMTNRETVSLMTKKKLSKGVVRYEFKGEDKKFSLEEDHIRIRNTEGYWELRTMDEGQVRVEQSFYGDPAGALPTWVINMFIVDGPLQTFKNLKQLAE